MILDIRWQRVNGSLVLMAYKPTNLRILPSPDSDGYITFDIRNYEWQPIEPPKEEESHARNN